MFDFQKFIKASRKWKHINPILPFSDSIKKIPSKLIQLSFSSVGIAFVLLVGTLNRVMIVELSFLLTVAMMVAMP